MSKYILVVASKDRYERPIELDFLKIYKSKELAVNEIKKWIYEIDILQRIEEIIERKETYVEDKLGGYHRFEYDNNGNLIFYSTGCLRTNEYCGHSCILKEVNKQ